MSITLGDVLLYLNADDSQLNGTLKGVEGKTRAWVGSLGMMLATGLGAAVAAAIGGAVALGAAAFKSGETLDQAFDTLIIKTGASGDALIQLQNDFRAVFASVPTAAQPLADVLSVLHDRTTLTGEGVQTLTAQLLESARLMGGDAATNAELYTRMMGDWSIANVDASATLDMVFAASQNTGIGMDRLMGLAVQFGAPMRLMGFSLEDTIALLAKWEAEGVNTELVMSSLRIAAGKFADEGKPLRESLLATFDSIKNNTDATAALNEGMDVFGARAGPDMVAAIREGRFEFEDLLAVLEGTEGAILDTADKTEDWGEKFTKLKNKATLALAPIGAKFMDMASMILEKAAPALDKLVPLIDQYVVPAVGALADALGFLLEGDIGKLWDFAMKGIFSIGQWIEGIDWNLLGLKIREGLAKVDWNGIGAAVGEFLKTAFKEGMRLAKEFDWGGLALSLGAALKDVILGIGGYTPEEWNTMWTNIKAQMQTSLDAYGPFEVIAEVLVGINAKFPLTGKPVIGLGLQKVLETLLDQAGFNIGLKFMEGFARGLSIGNIGSDIGLVIAPLIANLIGHLMTLKIQWDNVWNSLRGAINRVKSAFQIFVVWLGVTIISKIMPVVSFFQTKVVPAFDAVEEVIRAIIKAIKDLIAEFKKVEGSIPSEFTPGSPTPFETGLRGILDAMHEINRTGLPTFQNPLVPSGALAFAEIGGAGGGDVYNISVGGIQMPGGSRDTTMGDILEFLNIR